MPSLFVMTSLSPVILIILPLCIALSASLVVKLGVLTAAVACSFSVFLATVRLNSFEASAPFAGWPVTLMAKLPSEASSAPVSVTCASVSVRREGVCVSVGESPTWEGSLAQ